MRHVAPLIGLLWITSCSYEMDKPYRPDWPPGFWPLVKDGQLAPSLNTYELAATGYAMTLPRVWQSIEPRNPASGVMAIFRRGPADETTAAVIMIVDPAPTEQRQIGFNEDDSERYLTYGEVTIRPWMWRDWGCDEPIWAEVWDDDAILDLERARQGVPCVELYFSVSLGGSQRFVCLVNGGAEAVADALFEVVGMFATLRPVGSGNDSPYLVHGK